MKTLPFKLMALVLGVVGAASARADTPLKFGSDQIHIQGTSRVSADISVIVFYKPLYKFDKKVTAKGCEFPEDRWKPNENDVSSTLKAQSRKEGGYSLDIPTQGIRGTCPYVLESLYYLVEDKPISMNLTLLSERRVKQMGEELADVGGIGPVKNLTELNALFCEYKTDYENGFCYPAQDNMTEFYYGISNSAATYTLDVKDISERPERQY